MRFFFDNCVSVRFVQALRILAQIQEYELVHLTERFAADTPDEEWIRRLASDGDWVIISDDPRISRGQAQRKTWQESGLTAFFFADGWASKGFRKQAESLVHWWPQIVLKSERINSGHRLFDALERQGLQTNLYALLTGGYSEAHVKIITEVVNCWSVVRGDGASTPAVRRALWRDDPSRSPP